jgi:metallo-beta-lactamase family protein
VVIAKISQPRLIEKIHCSAPTKAIAKLILLDSAKIQKKKQNKGKYSKHEERNHFMMWNKPKVFPSFKLVVK